MNTSTNTDRTNLKLAFIKQDVYQDLYACPRDCQSPYLYSLMRSGPLGIFWAFATTCYVVRHEESSDLWREKIVDCAHHRSEEEWLKIPQKKVKYIDSWVEQRSFTTSINDINFEDYDIIIAVDACVPPSITKKTSKPLWCYYISECCMRSYNTSFTNPVEGYDIFLNQMFRPSSSPEYRGLASHVCEFPYTFQFPGIHSLLYEFPSQSTKSSNRSIDTISIPSYVAKEMSDQDISRLKQIVDVVVPSGSIESYLLSLNTSSAYARLGNATKFGNETIEAVCAGNLLISTTQGWRNRIFCPGPFDVNGTNYSVDQLNELINNIEILNNNPNLYQKEKARQDEIALEIGFKRPLQDLLGKYHEHNRKIINSTTQLLDAMQATKASASGCIQPVKSSTIATKSNDKNCLVFAFDAFDAEMARSTAIFYSQAGYDVEISKKISGADLIVWMRGKPPLGFRFSDFTDSVHYYPYVASPTYEDMECMQGTRATVIYPSESLLHKVKPAFAMFDYVLGMPPIWLGEWYSRYSTQPASNRITAPVHIGHFKKYNLQQNDPIQQDFIQACNRLGAHVWGREWECYVNTGIAKGVMSNPISTAYSKYRVALGIMYSYQRNRTISMRAWEAPLSGCVLLTEAFPRTKDPMPPGVIQVKYSDITADQIIDIQNAYDPHDLSIEALGYWQRRNAELFDRLGLEPCQVFDPTSFDSASYKGYVFS